MPIAEIITIGTEILLGEIIDTNSRHLARSLREAGIDIYRTMSVGDNPKRIADVIRDALQRADIVITTGGLGPTVDDPTREAVALAFGVETTFREALWEQVVTRFASFGRYPTENNRKQAYIPDGAVGLVNQVGTAPAFMYETQDSVVVSLPGVPREMEHILKYEVLPYLERRFPTDSVLKIRLLHTVGLGESQIDEKIHDLETLANPTVGLAAHAGQVDVRITAKAATEAEARSAIEPVEQELRERLGAWVYGADGETLGGMAMRSIEAQGWQLVALEAGLSGQLMSRMPRTKSFLRAVVLPQPPEDPQELLRELDQLRTASAADVGLGVGLYDKVKVPFLALALISPEGEKTRQIPYGGPPRLAPIRAANFGLNWLRHL